MALEIERKFLVKGEYKPDAFKQIRITQGYLSSVPERTVRVRIKGDRGFITVKGMGDAGGAARFEWEKEIPVEEIRALLKLAEPGVIDKTRYLVKNTDGKHVWENRRILRRQRRTHRGGDRIGRRKRAFRQAGVVGRGSYGRSQVLQLHAYEESI